MVVRCPYGAPAVTRQHAYDETGEPFPTTFYLTCPHAVARIGRLEAGGGVARYRALLAADSAARASLRAAAADQRRLREPSAVMADGGARLAGGIGGVADHDAIACLHAHAAFALARPGYTLGQAILDEAAPLYPAGGCCCR